MSVDPGGSTLTRDVNDAVDNEGLTIFVVLRVLGAENILKHVTIRDLLRLELVCKDWQREVQYYLKKYCFFKFCFSNDSLKTCFAKNYVTLSKNDPNSVKIVEQLRFSVQKLYIIVDRWPQHLLEKFESTKLTTLYIDLSKNCDSWDDQNLLSTIGQFKNITSLEISYYPIQFLNNIHLLFIGMPKLEILKLHRSIARRSVVIELNNEFIKSISQLYELKRLYITNNAGINDVLLVALSLGCKKLEYLDISGSPMGYVDKRRLTARGVAALCRRSPAAATTLDFSHYYGGLFGPSTADINLDDITFNNRLCQELEDLCCVDLRQRPELACLRTGHQVVRVQGRSGCNAVEAQDPQQELIIKLGGILIRGFSSFLN